VRTNLCPVPLGFYLERVDERTSTWTDIHYRGIDRLPYFLTPEEENDLTREGRTRLLELWEDLAAVEYEPKEAFNRSRLARLRDGFENEGVRFDLVYAEIVLVPNDLARYKRGALWKRELRNSLEQWISQVPSDTPSHEDFALLGYDISHPFPTFHSAINQPGLGDREPSLRNMLNRNGLLDEMSPAADLMAEANELDYGPLPFCVISVWAVEAGR
jgi:hypothetical protein